MAFCTVLSASVQGLGVEMIRVEADVSNGLPMFHMVGYLSSEVKEASERVRTAIRNAGMKLPAKKIVVNLAPATVRKKGASFDLPIALAVLAAMGYVPEGALESVAVIGELSLEGKIRGVPGVLPVVIEAKEQGCKYVILPEENETEGRLVKGIKILPADNLETLCAFLNGGICDEGSEEYKDWNANITGNMSEQTEQDMVDSGKTVKRRQQKSREDFADICGQKAVKRAAEIAVAGGHNLLMAGPPGSGKSMIAKRIATILPDLTWEESLEITKIYSVLGMVDREHPLIIERPFRNIHHTITRTALTGGGSMPRPGEISMAHGGVLFLDELAEFPRNVLEVLRQPLEERQIHIARNYGNFTFPAEFMLVAAMNPCPCGNYPDVQKCSCTPGQIQKYLGKISQPFLDRMDICIETPKVAYQDLDRDWKNREAEESSEIIRHRVTEARNIQRERYKGTDIRTNAVLGPREIGHYVELGECERQMMELAFERIGLTARTYHKILRVARTIADLDHSEKVTEKHLKEAIAYRSLDKKYWGH